MCAATCDDKGRPLQPKIAVPFGSAQGFSLFEPTPLGQDLVQDYLKRLELPVIQLSDLEPNLENLDLLVKVVALLPLIAASY